MTIVSDGHLRSGLVVAVVGAGALFLSACAGGATPTPTPSAPTSPAVRAEAAVNSSGVFVGPTQENPSSAAVQFFSGLGESHVPPADVLATMSSVQINLDDPTLGAAKERAVAQSVIRQTFLAEFFSYYPATRALGAVESEVAVGSTQWTPVSNGQSFNESGVGCLFPYRLSVVPLAPALAQAVNPGGPAYAVVAWWRFPHGCQELLGGKTTGTAPAGSMQQVLFLNSNATTRAVAGYVGGAVVQEDGYYVCGQETTASIPDAAQIEQACSSLGAN